MSDACGANEWDLGRPSGLDRRDDGPERSERSGGVSMSDACGASGPEECR
jgi:hypothetical protein